MKKEVINEICKFIIDKCEVMNIDNFKILSEMIVNDVKSIQSKLHQPTVSGSLPLADLEKRLDEALDKETPETLNKWLEEKRK